MFNSYTITVGTVIRPDSGSYSFRQDTDGNRISGTALVIIEIVREILNYFVFVSHQK